MLISGLRLFPQPKSWQREEAHSKADCEICVTSQVLLGGPHRLQDSPEDASRIIYIPEVGEGISEVHQAPQIYRVLF
jgi:hypothetical protein